MQEFNIKINGGQEQCFKAKSGVYRNVVAAIPAMLDVPLPCDIEIWVERLLPEYGPYHYRVRDDEYGRLVVETLHVAGTDNRAD